MRRWRESICLLLMFAFLAAGGSAEPPTQGASEKTETVPGPHADEAAHQKLVSPAAWPSITVVIREPAAPGAKAIMAVIQQQPYHHFWNSPNAPQWALFFLTIPYILVTVGLFVVTKTIASAAKQQAALVLAVERPLIVFVAAELDQSRHYRRLSDGRLALKSGLKPILEVVFANMGRSAAFDIGTRVEFAIGKSVPNDRPGIFISQRAPGVVLPPSVSDKRRDGMLRAEAGFEITQSDADAIRRRERVLYFWGVIEYSDAVGTRYETGIGGWLNLDRNPETGMFDPPAPQGYNYQA